MIPDWKRAHGGPLFSAVLKSEPDDFIVEELLGFDPDGDGEHDLLFVEKVNTNTEWLARQLARHADVPARDVGYCGLKDRHARTRQWFTVRRPKGGTDWEAFSLENVELLRCEAHRRKLRRGSHSGNHFELLLRATDLPAASIAERLDLISEKGVPNYFGEQRFGRDGANIEQFRSLAAGQRMHRNARGHAISAARALAFNTVLDQRVGAGTWDILKVGELANLDGTNSVFAVEELDDTLAERCRQGDVHPTGPLPGRGESLPSGDAASDEAEALLPLADMVEGLQKLGADSARRPLRFNVRNVSYTIENNGLKLSFELGSGSYATTVVREVASVDTGVE